MSTMLKALKNLSARTNTVPLQQPQAVASPATIDAAASPPAGAPVPEPAAADPVLPPVDHARRMKDLLRRHLSSPVLTEVVPQRASDDEADEPRHAANLLSRDFLPASQGIANALSLPLVDDEPAHDEVPPLPAAAAPLDMMANLLASIEEPSEPAEEVTLHLSTPLDEIRAQMSAEPPAADSADATEPPAAVEAASDPSLAAEPTIESGGPPAIPAEPPAAEVAAPASPLMHLSQGEPLVAAPPEDEPPAPAAPRVQPARTISRPKTQLEQRVVDDLSHPSRSQPYRELAERLKQDLRLLTGRCLLFAGIGPASHADDVLPFVARMLAEENEEVLLIDADFARAGLTIGLGGLKEPGLGELLETAGRGETLVLPTLLPNVSLLPAGRQSLPDALGVVEPVAQLITRLAERHSLILIDGGRNGGALVPALARLCDATYFVVRLGATDARAAAAALHSFRASGARVMGCVATSGTTGAAA